MVTSLTAAPFDVIGCDDPRLRLLVGAEVAGAGPVPIATVAAGVRDVRGQILMACRSALLAWARRTQTCTLEDLAQELLAAALPPAVVIPGAEQPRTRSQVVVAYALGLDGLEPQFMAAAGRLVGVTRERARQYVVAFEKRLGHRWLWAPTLDHALQIADGTLTGPQLSDSWLAHGLTRSRWHPAAVQSLAILCGRIQTVKVRLPEPPTRDCRPVLQQIAVRQVSTGSVVPVERIAQLVSAEHGSQVTVQQIAELLHGHSWFVVADRWVAGNGARATDLVQVATGMLTVIPSLTVEQIWHGLRRRMRTRSLHDVPPMEAVAAVLAACKTFTINGHDPQAQVTLATPMAPDQVYAGGDLLVIELLLQAPGQVLTRAQLLAATGAAGYTRGYVGSLLFGHELIRRHSEQLWTLVGVEVDEQHAHAARATLKHRRCQQLPDGRPYWTTNITPGMRSHGTIQYRTMRPYAGDYQLTGDPTASMTLRIRKDGILYGLHHYLRHTSHPDGTPLTIALDPGRKSIHIAAA